MQDTNSAEPSRIDGMNLRPMALSQAAAVFGPMYAVPATTGWSAGSPRPLTAVGWALACSLTVSLGCAMGTGTGGDEPAADDPYALAPASGAARPAAIRGASRPDAASGVASIPREDEQSLIDALASTYASDMAALADMQRTQRAASPRASAPPIEFAEPESSLSDGWAASVASAPTNPVVASAREPSVQRAPGDRGPKALIRAPSVTPSQKPPAPQGGNAGESTTPRESTTPSPTTTPVATTTPPVPAPPSSTPAQTEPASTARTAASSDAPASTAVPASPFTMQVNGALELPPPPVTVPTEPSALAKLLAESLARRGGESAEPLRDWFAYAALAVGDPDLELPEDFGADLLPAERERVISAHAGFVALGIALRDGRSEFDRSASESLVLALTGGPMLEIPTIALCTKVEGFGRYSTVGTHRFLARSNARFIVYAELDGFRSDLLGGAFTTRLATRITLESERDGIEVWLRSPEWTAVVDTSPVRREEFFLCEIVSLSEFLTVGSYRLKVEIRDELTGAIATTTTPIHVVADPGLASASQ